MRDPITMADKLTPVVRCPYISLALLLLALSTVFLSDEHCSDAQTTEFQDAIFNEFQAIRDKIP